MKYGKRKLSLLLILLMLLSLTGCSGFGTGIVKAAAKMQKLQSFRMDLNLDLGMDLSMLGESLDLDMAVTGPIDLTVSPLKAKADLSVDAMDETQKVLAYVDKTDAGLMVYASIDGGKTWVRSELQMKDLPETGGGKLDSKSIAALVKLAASFEESGTETVKGSEAVLYSGMIAWEDLQTVISFPELIESMGKALNVEVDQEELDFSNIEGIPLTIGLDRQSGMMVKFSMDLTELMQAIMPAVMQVATKAIMQESGLGALGDLGLFNLDALGLKLDLSRLTVSVELYDFDKVDEIVIPEAAVGASAIST